MGLKLYKGNGAESNRSDYIELRATLDITNETDTTLMITINYTIEKSTPNSMTDPGMRYGLLVKGFSVDDNGQITNRGSIIGYCEFKDSDAIKDVYGEQTGFVTFEFRKGEYATTYTGVTFLINDNFDSTTWNNDGTYMWTGQKGSSVNYPPDSYDVTEFTVPALGSSTIPTKCSAPTSVTASAGFVKPGDKITISWSGAEAGINNDIQKYRVYYNVGQAPTTGYQGYIGDKDSEDST